MSEGQAAAAVTTTGSEGQAGGAPANGGAIDWTAGLPEETRGYIQNKGFKDPATVVDSYRNLEKLLGVPKEQLLRLPKDDAAPEEWGQVYERLGRPSKPEEYKIPVPEKGGDPEFAKWAEKLFHENGLSRKQANSLAAKWNEYVGGKTQEALDAHNNQVLEQETALKKEWGKAFDQNVQIAKRAAQTFGLDTATIDKLESAMGFSQVIKFMHNIGSKIGEHSFVTGGRQEFGGVLTPEAAKDRISALKYDSDFVKRYTSGDVGAQAEFRRLHEQAYPE